MIYSNSLSKNYTSLTSALFSHLIHWGQDKMVAIAQMTFSYMEFVVFLI